MSDESVGDVAALYLGNILYAMELAAMSLEQEGRTPDAAFYRGIARKLAEAHGRTREGPPPQGQATTERPDSSS